MSNGSAGALWVHDWILFPSYQFSLRWTILDSCDCPLQMDKRPSVETANKTMGNVYSPCFVPFYWLPATCWVFGWHKDSPFNAIYFILYQSHVQLTVKCLWWLWEPQMSCNWPLIALSSVNLMAKSQLCSSVHDTVITICTDAASF